MDRGLEWHRLHRLRKKDFFVIPFTVNVHGEPSEARDLLFFSASKKQQIPRANPALRNDMVRLFPQPVQPAGFRPCKDQDPLTEAYATAKHPATIVGTLTTREPSWKNSVRHSTATQRIARQIENKIRAAFFRFNRGLTPPTRSLKPIQKLQSKAATPRQPPARPRPWDALWRRKADRQPHRGRHCQRLAGCR